MSAKLHSVSPEQAFAAATRGRSFDGKAPAANVVKLPTLRAEDLHLGDTAVGVPVGLHLPKLLLGRLLIQGNSGAGKSSLLRRLFEQAFGRVQQLVVDVDGEFSTLRDGFDVAIVTAADVDRVGGRAFALHLREHRYSAVLDLSDASSEDRLRLVADIAAGLIEAPEVHWHPLLVLVDEAQTLAPHYDTGDVDPETRKRAISSLAELMGRGRKRGIAGVIATQRLAETSKAVCAKATNVIIGRTFLDLDLDRAGALLGFTKGQSRPIRSLADGEFICLGPALAGPTRMRFRAGPTVTRHKGDAPAVIAPPKISAAAAAALLQQLPQGAPAPETVARAPGRAPRIWSAAEDELVRAGYVAGKKLPEINNDLVAAGFAVRSLSAISVRGQLLGLINPNRSGRQWSPAEDEILRAGYSEGARLVDIVARLSRAGYERHRQATQMRAIALGITGDRVNYWSEEEKGIAIAGLDAGKRHADILADLRAAGYHRGTTAINRFAKLHGRQRPHDNPWTDEHLDILRECYASGAGPKAAATRLGRPYSSIVGKASALGISVNREYTIQEREKMIGMHGAGARLLDVAKALGKPYHNVQKIASKMGLSFSHHSGRPRKETKAKPKTRRHK